MPATISEGPWVVVCQIRQAPELKGWTFYVASRPGVPTNRTGTYLIRDDGLGLFRSSIWDSKWRACTDIPGYHLVRFPDDGDPASFIERVARRIGENGAWEG